MNFPIKCKNMYIKFDANKNPEYGFEVSGNKILKFVPLSNDKIDTIILPCIAPSELFEMPKLNYKEINNSWQFFCIKKIKKYVDGAIEISPYCFKGIDKAKIIAPFENSIKIDTLAFDDNAKIEFIVHHNLTLKQVHKIFNSGIIYEKENWLLIGDKTVSGSFDAGGFSREQYLINDYDKELIDNNSASVTVLNKLPKPVKKVKA